MAKGRSHSRGERDTSVIATPTVLSPVSPSSWNLGLLRAIEDRRTFHPERGNRPALSLSGTAARYTVADARPSKKQAARGFKVPSQTKAHVAFAEPNQVVVCIRRKMRKQVLHAFKKTGRRGRRRRYRRSWRSLIRC